MFCLTSFLFILCFGMSSNAPDFGTTLAARETQASASQSGGGKSGMSPDQLFQGLQQNGTKGFDNPIIKGEHNDIIAQIDNKMDKAFGSINAFKDMQTLNTNSIQAQANLNTAGNIALGHNALGVAGGGQGH